MASAWVCCTHFTAGQVVAPGQRIADQHLPQPRISRTRPGDPYVDRFLGGFEWTGPHGRYVDQSTGDVTRFHGQESILVDDVSAYTLDYFGGLIKP